MTEQNTTPEPAPPMDLPPGPEPSGAPPTIDDAAAVIVVDATAPAGRKGRRRRFALLFFLLAALALFASISGVYLATRKPIEVIIIPEISTEKMPHYSFSIYGAARPIGVAVSPSGDRIYVSESGGSRLVQVFDGKGSSIGTLTPPQAKVGHVPVYLAIDAQNGDVYVSDRPTGSIYIYDKDGAFQRAFEPAKPIDGWQPLGLAFSPQGDLWVTDLSAPFHRIEVFGRDGALKQTIGKDGDFNFPNAIAFDAGGNAYVSDSNNGRLVVIDSTGGVTSAIGRGSGAGDLGLPRGTAVDDTGHLYVVDAIAQAVQIYRVGADASPNLRFLGGFGAAGVQDGEFQFPNGVAVDTRARIYVTDRENNRVQVWSY